MRKVNRMALPRSAQAYLNRRQSGANTRQKQGVLDIEREWKAARQTQAVGVVLQTLQQMMGPRQRCMYCVDSHGSDIEHFRPKARFTRHAFRWTNLLLCCTECGRLKGSSFPLRNRLPLLIDPAAEDPWTHIDFDPDTGNLSARFDLAIGEWSAKGTATVDTLQLDRREAMAKGYLLTYRRLAEVIRTALPKLTDDSMSAAALCVALKEADEHGLLPWCLTGNGLTLSPFSDLHDTYPEVWVECAAATQ